jgi:FKBP-type peptidyl-prolyl cis-trans isomerase
MRCCALLVSAAVTTNALRLVGRRAAVGAVTGAAAVLPQQAFGKCKDIESCREIGEAKVAADEATNPVIRLSDGVRYKRVREGAGASVSSGDVVDVAYSISTAGGSYMYSRGFGFEKDSDGVVDAGDFLRVRLGNGDVPRGIEIALRGMKEGEKRRVELPPGPVTGFETSEWKPAPTTRRGKAQIVAYKNLINGNGSSQPPFPAVTVWEIECRRIRGR